MWADLTDRPNNKNYLIHLQFTYYNSFITTSTAAGRPVQGANVFGNAKGTAVGMAPDAHLAIYKVCNIKGCIESSILAGMDTVIGDGVDVLSLYLGGPSSPFFEDGIALGAFSAIQKGIFVSCSAANGGPDNGTLSNEAPWILTIGASTIDRKIMATTKLGNGKVYIGESMFQPKDFSPTLLPLVYAGAANARSNSASFCAPGSLNKTDFVKGKIVLCEQGGFVARVAKGQAVKDAGGAAMILMNSEREAFNPIVDVRVLPTVHAGKGLLDERLKPADVFATGAGHVNPLKANCWEITQNFHVVSFGGSGKITAEIIRHNNLITEFGQLCLRLRAAADLLLNKGKIQSVYKHSHTLTTHNPITPKSLSQNFLTEIFSSS